jgi:Acetyltransferase (GNAT) domain
MAHRQVEDFRSGAIMPQKPGFPGLFAINPIEDPRWAAFITNHPKSSAYHSVEWLTALQKAYGYTPIAFTTSPPTEALRNGIVFCDVETWLTGRRLISLPFSDHCAILCDNATESTILYSALGSAFSQYGKQFRYIEIRPTEALDVTALGPQAMQGYCGHQLDLRADLNTLFKNCHRNSTQRKIWRAEREGLKYEAGRSPDLLSSFYCLLILTRRRHGIPPQPKKWFQSLIDVFGSNLEIRVASVNDRPIAAMMTLRYKEILLFKYGASDHRFHNLGGVHLLFWRSISTAKQEGMRMFDLGRSAWNNTGLITFKDRWGAERVPLTYFRLPPLLRASDSLLSANPDWRERAARKVFSHMPGSILRVTGALIYPHLG